MGMSDINIRLTVGEIKRAAAAFLNRTTAQQVKMPPLSEDDIEVAVYDKQSGRLADPNKYQVVVRYRRREEQEEFYHGHEDETANPNEVPEQPRPTQGQLAQRQK